MSRVNFNEGQELVYQDLNKMGAAAERELYDRVVYELLQRSSNGVFQDGFVVGYVGSALCSVNKGVGFQTDNTQSSPEPQQRLLYTAASQNLAIAAPDTSNDRIDLVVIQAARAASLTESRNYKATTSSTPVAQSFTTETDWQATLQVVTGTPATSPVAPAVPSGFIALASMRIHAVTGLTGTGDITDLRVQLPIGGNVALNTLALSRITQGSAVSMSAIIASIDAWLVRGYQNYTDFDNLGATPAVPSGSKLRFYLKNGSVYTLDSSGVETLAGGGGGGGGGGANWNPGLNNAPQADVENGEKVWLFAQGDTQQLALFVKVPESYIAGKQIKMYLGIYSPSGSNTILMATTTYLVRDGVDAVTSTANSQASGNTALTNTLANMYRKITCPLTDATGKINGFSVQPGALLRVVLARGTDTDTADVRFIPSATEVKFS